MTSILISLVIEGGKRRKEYKRKEGMTRLDGEGIKEQLNV
jgi:hypothetical protein